MVLPYIFMEPSENMSKMDARRCRSGVSHGFRMGFPWPLSQADPASSAPVLAAKKLKAEDVQRVVKFYAKEKPVACPLVKVRTISQPSTV